MAEFDTWADTWPGAWAGTPRLLQASDMTAISETDESRKPPRHFRELRRTETVRSEPTVET